MSVSRLPWAHRKQIGRFRAYWRTNLMAIVRSGKIAEEMNRPVSFHDSQRFRHVTVLLAWVPLAMWGIGWLVADTDRNAFASNHASGLGSWFERLFILSAVAASWLFLLMISGSGSYFFHPRSMPVVRQNRAVALSYYECAPLAWLWLPAALFGLGWAAAFASAAAVILIYWFLVIVLMRRTTHCGAGRTVAAFIFMPVSWVLLSAISAIIPLAILLISLIILSFR
jgi:hypothetical protein